MLSNTVRSHVRRLLAVRFQLSGELLISRTSLYIVEQFQFGKPCSSSFQCWRTEPVLDDGSPFPLGGEFAFPLQVTEHGKEAILPLPASKGRDCQHRLPDSRVRY
ncbi:unnamed protein product [Heligmosomoides polygyrus]|uniref:Transposase n=1 Tax=Heligmosomoides polygyrus TaxID=6339 RepID=A0A183F6U8_HELPZ|nr:unnamed protein product [Heligmosomoides polygyrus]